MNMLTRQEIDVVGKPMIPSALKTSGNVTSVTPDCHSDAKALSIAYLGVIAISTFKIIFGVRL